jgi:hypothetical protein
MLSILNIVMIAILSLIIAMNMYNIIKLQYTQAFIRDELEKKVLSVIHNMDLTDLKEFNDLEPHVKQYYKDYVAGAIIPLMVKRFNVLMMTTNEYSRLKNNKDVIKKEMDSFLVDFKKELEKMSIEFITNIQQLQLINKNTTNTT